MPGGGGGRSVKAGYDLDGVLALGPPPAAKSWMRMKGPERKARLADLVRHYAAAPRLPVTPWERRFAVITARKDTPEVREATERWLRAAFPGRVLALRMLTESRSVENVVAFKAAAIRELGLTDFTEDNPKIVAGLRALKLCRVWHYWRGTISLESGRDR